MAARLNHRIHAAEVHRYFRRILVGLSTMKGDFSKMRKEDSDMIEKIFDSERVGCAYLYPRDGGARQDSMISTTPENIANYIGSHMYDAQKIIITDMCDRLVLNTCGCFIDSCPDQKLCRDIIPFLAPIQMGEKEAGEVLEVSMDVANEYFAAEDEAVTMAEMGMQ